jgi:hypothetical protein
MLAAALDQARCPARRALAFGEDDAPGTPPAEPAELLPEQQLPAAEAAPEVSEPGSESSPSRFTNLTLPLAALLPLTAAELAAGSPVASPHHDQRNTRDQVGPSSNTRRMSQTQIPAMPGAEAPSGEAAMTK